MTAVSEYVRRHFRHFNAATLVDAAAGWSDLLSRDGTMLLTMGGAMSRTPRSWPGAGAAIAFGKALSSQRARASARCRRASPVNICSRSRRARSTMSSRSESWLAAESLPGESFPPGR
jgi:hypothetical protein